MTEPARCSEMLYRDWSKYQCRNKGVISRDGKWFCRIHDPVAIAEARERRDVAYNAKWIARRAEERLRENNLKVGEWLRVNVPEKYAAILAEKDGEA